MSEPFFIADSKIHGRGCFAIRKIWTGEYFRVPVILVPRDTESRYVFPWDRENKSICLSAITMCNSSENPNLKIVSIDPVKLLKTFQVIRDVNAGQEIFLKYRI